MPPPSSLMLLDFLVLPGEGRVWCYGAGYCCAPSLLLDTASFSVLTVEWRVWSYGVGYCWAPYLPLDTAVFFCFDVNVEGMVLRGLVLLCPLRSSLHDFTFSCGR